MVESPDYQIFEIANQRIADKWSLFVDENELFADFTLILSTEFYLCFKF
jgi:hypothetical protein